MQRLEQRLGGSFDQRADDELFVVDKGESKDAPAAPTATSRRAARKKAAAEKPLKCFQNILPDVERPKHVTPGTRRNPVVAAKEKKLRDQGVVKAKEKMAMAHKAQAAAAVAVKAKVR